MNSNGRAFNDVEFIESDRFNELMPGITVLLESIGCSMVTPVGSAGVYYNLSDFTGVLGDIDVAARSPKTREELYTTLCSLVGQYNLKKVGSNIISIRIENMGRPFQLDLMLGNVDYLVWSRIGHPKLKGSVRNILLNIVNRVDARRRFPGAQSLVDRRKLVLDFDAGLFDVVQTKRPRMKGRPVLKEWRNVQKNIVSDSPDVIVKTMFGGAFNRADCSTLEGVIKTLKGSPITRWIAGEVMDLFMKEINEILLNDQTFLGADPADSIRYIESI